MNTQILLKTVQQIGVHLEARGDKLRAEAPQDVLTPELVAEFKTHKADLLDILGKPGAERIAQDHGLTLADLKQAAGPDWPEIENDPATLEALARSIQTRRMRERSEVPPHYTATTICVHCGPVPIFPDVAERVEGCPWCFNRVAGLPVPKPQPETYRDCGAAMLTRPDRGGDRPPNYEQSKVRIGRESVRDE